MGLLELPKFPQPAGLRLGSQIWKGLFFRPFSYHNKSSAVIFSSQSGLCPFWGAGGGGWWWWRRQIRNSYCKKNYKHQKKGPSPPGVQCGRRVRRVRPTLHTRSQGQENLGPTWSIFGLQIGLKLLINARTLTSEY